MSIFSNMFGAEALDFEKVGWQKLTSIDQLDEIAEKSASVPVVIFKHSTTCGISAAAQDRLFDGWDLASDEVLFYHLDLLANRKISNEVAARFGIVHHSPQVILIKDGKAVFNTSHHSISVEGMKRAL